MNFHVIAGLPRSGSTLLCNILNQNNDMYASSTSCMGRQLRILSNLWSNAPEIKGALIRDENRGERTTQDQMWRTARANVEVWYAHREESYVFDKDRTWNSSALMLNHVFPEAHMFVCVRDLRDILASVEKQHARNPLLETAGTSEELTAYNRADRMLSREGVIGQHIMGVEDLCRRQLPFVHFIQFETLVHNPKLVLDSIYATIGADMFKHDFDNVENTAEDIDSLYLHKFPHVGSGKVKPPSGNWRDHISVDIANKIMQTFTFYNKCFGYRGDM